MNLRKNLNHFTLQKTTKIFDKIHAGPKGFDPLSIGLEVIWMSINRSYLGNTRKIDTKQFSNVMADIFTKEKRSWIMSRIKGKNTKIELKMNKILRDIGYAYEMHPKMYGNPDFVLEKERIAIFCDGDFWYGFNYRKKYRGKSSGGKR